jgi:hypothetical protein
MHMLTLNGRISAGYKDRACSRSLVEYLLGFSSMHAYVHWSSICWVLASYMLTLTGRVSAGFRYRA